MFEQSETGKYHPELGKYCDHTVLKAYTKRGVVEAICDEAIKYNTASVCVNPTHVALVKEKLKGTGIKTCCVIGFPLGANTTATKVFETLDAIGNGAEELDMVINIGALRDGDHQTVYQDIKGVVDAAFGKASVKVIIETGYLTNEEIVTASELCVKAGADYVKTSTGFSAGVATVEDVRLMKKTVGNAAKIKASAGIKTQEKALMMIEAGADRLGVSSTVQIVTGNDRAPSASDNNQEPVK